MFPVSISPGECLHAAPPACSGLRAPSDRMNATTTCDDGHANKMRKIDVLNAASDIFSGRSGQVLNPQQLTSNSPLRLDMSQKPNMPLFAAHPMYAFNPYAAAAFGPCDPRAYQAALFMQQQQMSAMPRMGFLQPMPLPQPFIPAPAAAVKAELVLDTPTATASTPERTAAGTDAVGSEARRSTRSQSKKREFSQITPSDHLKPHDEEDDADLDETSFLLTSMTQSNSPTTSPAALSVKLEKVPSCPEQPIAVRRARRALSVDVPQAESPTDPGSPNGPSSPSSTSPASPDSFEDKFGSEAPFSSVSASLKKGSLACPECGKVFSQGCSLKDHMNIHAGVRPYVCKDCGKSFSNGSNLNRHRRIHTGEKPYVCDVCQKSFSQSSNLKVHMRIHY